MNLDKCFELELKENPTDDRMLIYADWLEEQGKECKANAIRRLISDVHNDTLKEIDWKELLPLWQSYWTYAGFNTQPANRIAAEAAVDELYKNAGFPSPKLTIWLDSPLAGCIGGIMLNQAGEIINSQTRNKVWKIRDQVWDQVNDKIWDIKEKDQIFEIRKQLMKIRDQMVMDTLEEFIREQIWEEIRRQINQVDDQIWEEIRNQMWNQAKNQTNDRVGSRITNKIKNQDKVTTIEWLGRNRNSRYQTWNQLYQCGYGQHDASWLSFYNFLSVAGCHMSYRLKPHWQLARNCGWWWPFENAIILTERPARINFDDQGRLQAILYRDEFNGQFKHDNP